MKEQYEIIRINSDTWRIEEPGVRFFLLAGTEKALLIDSGMFVQHAREIAQGLTDLPIELLNTHGDRDHTGSNHEFDAVYMHPAELSNYHNTQGTPGKTVPVWDGDVLDLGNRRLSVIALPGHTPGSIAVLDEKYRALISGDPIQDGEIFLFDVQREMSAYRQSLVRLKRFADQFDLIYPSHGTFPLETGIIDGLIAAAEGVMEGKYTPQERKLFDKIWVRSYDVGIATFLCDMPKDDAHVR